MRGYQMVPSILFEIMLIGLLGIGAQWAAWRYRIPAIVVMSVTGLLVGPILGFINPEEDFGNLYNPIISVAVAIILFEGSLNLNFKEHTSELQSRFDLVCRLLLEKKKYNSI